MSAFGGKADIAAEVLTGDDARRIAAGFGVREINGCVRSTGLQLAVMLCSLGLRRIYCKVHRERTRKRICRNNRITNHALRGDELIWRGLVMAPLRNPRHERFVGLLLEGKDATDAYEVAGFKRDDGNAARLKANPRVAERLAELQAEIAAETTVTVQGLINELESARKAATDLKQLSAAIKAIEGKAKLSGLLVERQKVEITSDSFEEMDDPHQIALVAVDHELKYKIEPYHDFTEDDRQRLAEIFLEFVNAYNDATQKIIKEIRARPLKVSYKPPKALPSRI